MMAPQQMSAVLLGLLYDALANQGQHTLSGRCYNYREGNQPRPALSMDQSVATKSARTCRNILIVCLIAGTVAVLQMLSTEPVTHRAESFLHSTLPHVPNFSVLHTYQTNSFSKVCPSLPPSSSLLKYRGPAGVSCYDLITNNLTQKQQDRLQKYQEKHKPRKVYNWFYLNNNTKNCPEFKRLRGYHTDPTSSLEVDFPIAYNIIMHKDIYQMEYLLRAIYRPQNVYCIHIDSSQPERLIQAVQALARCFHNVYIATKLENVVYEGFSRLQADINCMRDHLNSDVQWKYLINTAAQSFPLKTNEEIVKILKIFNGANNIEAYVDDNILEYRTSQVWKVASDGKKEWMERTEIKNPPPPGGLKLLKGSAYGLFSRQFVHFVTHDKLAREFLNWSRTTVTPDEHYWATLQSNYTNPQLNTPGGYNGEPKKYNNYEFLATYVIWDYSSMVHTGDCHGTSNHGICIFGVYDLPNLVKQPEVFANKFYYDYQPLTLHCLNDWLEYKVTCPQALDEQFYTNLSFVFQENG